MWKIKDLEGKKFVELYNHCSNCGEKYVWLIMDYKPLYAEDQREIKSQQRNHPRDGICPKCKGEKPIIDPIPTPEEIVEKLDEIEKEIEEEIAEEIGSEPESQPEPESPPEDTNPV